MLSRIKRKVAFWMLLCALLALAGCGSTSCYVLKDNEIIYLEKGEAMTAPYKGVYLSDRAVQRIMDVKIIDTNLK